MTEAETRNVKRRKALLRHVNNVRDNCVKLGELLIENGEEELGHQVIANGYCHDQSKFHGIEWESLWGMEDSLKEENEERFKAAHEQHVKTNKHHPEAWPDGIHSMDRLHIAEMVCDWAARSQEFGTDLREYIKSRATKRFDFTFQSKVYKEIKYFVDLLLDKAFA